MKNIIFFIGIVVSLSSVSYAFCPFKDTFTIVDNTGNLTLLDNKETSVKFIQHTAHVAINSFIEASIDNSGNSLVINQNECGGNWIERLILGNSFSTWKEGLLQIKLGENEKNYCNIDIWDGAEMDEAKISRSNCVGKFSDKQIGLTHTLSTSNYQITIN